MANKKTRYDAAVQAIQGPVRLVVKSHPLQANLNTYSTMNKPILLSIHPNWADLILSGAKTLELRKTLPRDINPAEPVRIWLYATSPIKAIVGIVDLVGAELINWCRFNTDRDYCNYLHIGSCVLVYDIDTYNPRYAWKLEAPLRLNTPVKLPEGIKPPQSWCYLGPDKEDFLLKLLKEANDTLSKTR